MAPPMNPSGMRRFYVRDPFEQFINILMYS
jgi:hypothetical protein